MNDAPRRPLVRPAFLRGSLVVFVLLVPFVVHAVWDYLESRRLAAILAEIRAAHEPTSLYQAEHQEASTRESVEAARYYRAAAALATPNEHDRSPSPAAAEALAFLDRAAALPFDTFHAGTAYNYLTAELITADRLVHDRTRRLAAAGDGDGAAASLFTQIRLMRAVDQSFARLTRMSELVPDLGFVLSRSRPSAAALVRLAATFAESDDDNVLRQILLRERGLLLDRETRNLVWWSRPLALKTVNDRLENLRALLVIASRPWPRPLDLPVGGYTVGNNDARAMLRSVDESKVRLSASNTALARAARIAIAAVQYRDARGSWPPSVAALVPDFLPAVPVDPYRGEPMRSIVEDDGGFVAYSVGLNNRDEHGRLHPAAGSTRSGLSRAMAEGDLGVRITAR